MADDNSSDPDAELLIHHTPYVRDYGNESFRFSLITASIAVLATLNFGYAIGYPSPLQKQIEADYLNDVQFSWFTSLMAVGAMLASFCGKFFLEKLGRKYTIMSTALFNGIGYILIIVATKPYMFYIGRTFTGFASGMSSLAVSMYISEISSPKYRGGLSSLVQLSVTVGVFFGFLFGTVLPSFRWSAIVPLIVAALMCLFMIKLPESPRFDILHGKRNRALASLKWLRGSEYDVEKEVDDFESNLMIGNDNDANKLRLADFGKRTLFQPLIIGAMVMVFQQFGGINAIISYCTNIFSTANVKNANVVSVIISIIQIVFTLLSCFMVDKFGRRILLLVSGFLMFSCTFVLGVYYDITIFNDGKNHIDIFHDRTVPVKEISWLAIVCVIIYISAFSIGMGPIPWILMSELFSPSARDTAGSIVNLVNWTCAFLVMRFYPNMLKTFYVQGVFWFYAGFSLLSFVFVMFFVPETKGKTLEQIEEYFGGGKKKKNWK